MPITHSHEARQSFLFDNAMDLPEGAAAIEVQVAEGPAAFVLFNKHFAQRDLEAA
ncbi:hypothetical protein [Variovorax sp. PMC12]|uniref:hypothetical protein n=1 Tax=Variovorax sp. PMC12 TaxID=2126319 RepID=UPI00131C793E|nr:hypothetical protein [Variovorax sp. PMC12]